MLKKLENDPDTRAYGKELRQILRQTLEDSATPEQVTRLGKLDMQWKNMKALEKAAQSATVEGAFTPNRLSSAVSNTFDDAAYGGGGDLATLAKGGKTFKNALSSGTAENLTLARIAESLIAPMGVGVGAAMQFGTALPTTAALAGGAATYGLGHALGRAMTSDTYRNMLINQTLNPNTPNMMNLLAPGAINANDSDNSGPLRIEIRPSDRYLTP